jgi:cell wall-associated NlpC family hydrolase
MSSYRILKLCWIALIPIAIGFWYSSVLNSTVRFGFVLAMGMLLVGTIFLTWRKVWIRNSILIIYGLGTLFLICPYHSSHNSNALRTSYIGALNSYRECKYVWGGEGRFGIDCSGLIRRSWVDATVKEGVLTLNPRLVRTGASVWWNDTTAAVIGTGYSDRTHLIVKADSINQLDHSLLLPGDLAVTAHGIHILAYLGNRQWISADPSAAKVIINNAEDKTNGYLFGPVHILRWKLLDVVSEQNN